MLTKCTRRTGSQLLKSLSARGVADPNSRHVILRTSRCAISRPTSSSSVSIDPPVDIRPIPRRRTQTTLHPIPVILSINVNGGCPGYNGLGSTTSTSESVCRPPKNDSESSTSAVPNLQVQIDAKRLRNNSEGYLSAYPVMPPSD